jgi:hypothetical protein
MLFEGLAFSQECGEGIAWQFKLIEDEFGDYAALRAEHGAGEPMDAGLLRRFASRDRVAVVSAAALAVAVELPGAIGVYGLAPCRC